MSDPRAQALLDFWFGPDYATVAPEEVAARQSAVWFGKHAGGDADIAARFEALLQDAASNRLDDWTESAPTLLALVILLDQFPRNIYRGTPRAFAFDELARQCCQLLLATGFDRTLPAIARLFAYLPLEHSEDIDDQHYAVELIGALAREHQANDAQRQAFAGFADYARRHRDVIAQFGRFPHRNAILGRASTIEETDFLKQPGSSF
ncbi:DUF924 family protein [Herbaspirillum sp. alder98]|uniref:DUF924 family protein n=1 Tax=Herbaspirillum sp. alder98 TaxID=2913096 RepID=UPI001CD87D44|nr:DUF924 family protein [Herbaspirillum sp. alder98]MCA1324865.1 DUF924 domain-containing protein [Herbaspirillum sp. alder98]